MMRNEKTRSLAIVLSLALHAALVAVLLFLGEKNPLFDTRKMIEVDLVDAEKMLEAYKKQVRDKDTNETKGQIVEQSETRINDETPKDAKFLSRHNQTVIRETVAANHGKFKNTPDHAGDKALEPKPGKAKNDAGNDLRPQETAASDQTQKPTPNERKTLTAEDGINTGSPSLKDLTPNFRPGPPRVDQRDIATGGGTGPSASDDHIKNVPTGMQTLLSTREFVYYSYYNRIKDKLRQYWEPKIKEKMERIMRQGRTIASSQDRITRIIIVLDDQGTLVGVQVVGPSGVQDLDEAAIEAFRAAAPFPNPPKGIVEPDGTIKIRWDFILEANAGGIFQGMRVAYRQSR